jgi:hypothetical protein
MALLSDLTEFDIQKRIRALTRETEQLRREASKRGGEVVESASGAAQELYGAIAERLAGSLPLLRGGARRVERKVHDHPAVVAAVGLALIGLTVTLLLRRR